MTSREEARFRRTSWWASINTAHIILPYFCFKILFTVYSHVERCIFSEPGNRTVINQMAFSYTYRGLTDNGVMKILLSRVTSSS